MDCKTTSIRPRRAFTLVEFLVAAGIGSLVLVATAALLIYSSNSFAAMFNYADLDNQSQKKRIDFSREDFIAKVWEWKAESGGQITRQLRRLSASSSAAPSR